MKMNGRISGASLLVRRTGPGRVLSLSLCLMVKSCLQCQCGGEGEGEDGRGEGALVLGMFLQVLPADHPAWLALSDCCPVPPDLLHMLLLSVQTFPPGLFSHKPLRAGHLSYTGNIFQSPATTTTTTTTTLLNYQNPLSGTDLFSCPSQQNFPEISRKINRT